MKKRIFVLILTLMFILSSFSFVTAAALSKGDADGDGNITASDARFALRCSVSLEKPTDAQKKALDTDKDGSITASDARTILRVSVNLPVEGFDDATKTSLSVSLASEPDTLDPTLNSAVDGATICTHLFAGLAKWEQDAKGNVVLVADCAKELVEGVTNKDGTVTYTYTLKDGLKWSDGKPLTAYDFEFSWQRAASPILWADYNYLFEVVKGYAEIWETDSYGYFVNPYAELAVEATNDKTLVVTLYNDVAYWNELLAFPIFYPVREDVVDDEYWATDPSTYVCNGEYIIESWDHDSLITLKKNENYHDASKVTMSELKFYLTDDADTMVNNYKNGEWLFIDDVPTNKLNSLKKDYPAEFVTEGQLGTYYACWNINEDILPENSTLEGADAEIARAEIRKAINLLIDRNYIVEKVAQGGQLPASSFVSLGITNPDGTEFCKTANSTKDAFDGYYDVSPDAHESNRKSAIATLKKYYKFNEATGKFTNFPQITYLYNYSEGHKAVGKAIADDLASVGITMVLEAQEWGEFLNSRWNGDYTFARNGWLSDYNDPISFLEMYTTNSGSNDIQYGWGVHADMAIYNLDLTPYGYSIKVKNGTWAQTYDVLIATIKNCKDTETRYKLMHLAEDMLMSTGCIMPLYFYTDIFMLDSSVDGFFTTPLGYKHFMYCTIS